MAPLSWSGIRCRGYPRPTCWRPGGRYAGTPKRVEDSAMCNARLVKRIVCHGRMLGTHDKG
eukprot:scaffold14029_cov121-Isochrysis_galbana.AAC.7